MQGVVMIMEKTLQELADFLHGTLENEDPYRRTWSSAIKAGPVL